METLAFLGVLVAGCGTGVFVYHRHSERVRVEDEFHAPVTAVFLGVFASTALLVLGAEVGLDLTGIALSAGLGVLFFYPPLYVVYLTTTLLHWLRVRPRISQFTILALLLAPPTWWVGLNAIVYY